MNTVYDWISVLLFAGLVVLFLQRSDQVTPPRDALWQYLVAAGGCALVNRIGNGGHHMAAILSLLSLLGFIGAILRPWHLR